MDINDSVINLNNPNFNEVPKTLSVLPLRDNIIFPYMIFPVLIGRASTLKAIAEAVERGKYIFVSAQIDGNLEEPTLTDIYKNGTVARIIQVIKLPNNMLKVLLEGLFHATIKRKKKTKEFLEAEIEIIPFEFDEKDKELKASIRHTQDVFAEYVKNNGQLPPDVVGAFRTIEDPVRKLYYAAANIRAEIAEKQKILDKKLVKEQYLQLSSILLSELELLKLEDEIDSKINDSIQRTQKKFYIQEQIRALQKELGDEDESVPEIMALKELLDKANLPEHAKKKADEELEKLRKTPSMSPEFSVNRTYLELLAQVPWHIKTDDNYDIINVSKILDEDHHDLAKPKDRILEFISVLNLAGSLKRQILCFSGPPGVGKTSLARSIARALGRKFIRISLGGVRDEAEIRGHRRTYIGALPGKIIQSMKKAETINPVILLDEIDKMSMDFRGDPSSALLEVLDPEQNVNFNDHYLEVDYDLSNVLFITTANVKYDIPLPLLDRMEVIELSSYLDPDKEIIAKKHILPRLLKEYGLDKIDIEFKDEAIAKIITEYTREAGVRNLEREIASVLRKLVKGIVTDYDKLRISKDIETLRTTSLLNDKKFLMSMKKKKFVIDGSKIEEYLKAPRFKVKKEDLVDKVGVATGLAWTSVGGDILPIEVNIMPGADKLTLTGKLGDVMKESALASFSFIKSNHKEFGIAESVYKKKEIHIHIPEGAIPKDGPSAGITMTLALISALRGIPLKGDLAMTGEITLRGKVLAIGGLNEKLLAAKKAGIKQVLVPKDNERDVVDISEVIKSQLDIIFVSQLQEALPIAFPDEFGKAKVKTIKAKKQ